MCDQLNNVNNYFKTKLIFIVAFTLKDSKLHGLRSVSM